MIRVEPLKCGHSHISYNIWDRNKISFLSSFVWSTDDESLRLITVIYYIHMYVYSRLNTTNGMKSRRPELKHVLVGTFIIPLSRRVEYVHCTWLSFQIYREFQHTTQINLTGEIRKNSRQFLPEFVDGD